jgi:hypothetical protein
MGKIADILQQRGETEEALRILSEEVLPAAERIRDKALIAHTLYKSASVRLNCGGLENQEDARKIVNEIRSSFELFCRLNRADGIAVVGSLCGQLLGAAGIVDEAIVVLEKAANAYDGLRRSDQGDQLRALALKLKDGG